MKIMKIRLRYILWKVDGENFLFKFSKKSNNLKNLSMISLEKRTQ